METDGFGVFQFLKRKAGKGNVDGSAEVDVCRSQGALDGGGCVNDRSPRMLAAERH